MKRIEILALVVFALLLFAAPVQAQEAEPGNEADAVEVAPADEVVADVVAEEPADGPLALPEDVIVAIFGTGGLLFMTTQLLKGIIVVVQKYVPSFKVSEGFMGIANIVIGALLYGGISLAQLRGLEVAGIVDALRQGAELLLGLVFMVAGSTAYYAAFKKLEVPYFGHSLTPKP